MNIKNNERSMFIPMSSSSKRMKTRTDMVHTYARVGGKKICFDRELLLAPRKSFAFVAIPTTTS